MENLSIIFDITVLMVKNILGFIFLAYLVYFIFTVILNVKTRRLYKREENENCKKFSAKRCFEDGAPKYRDYIYLVEKNENKRYYRIVNLFTLDKLGYPKPSREDNDCFKISDGYVLGSEIKIYNLISDVKEILKLKPD